MYFVWTWLVAWFLLTSPHLSDFSENQDCYIYRSLVNVCVSLVVVNTLFFCLRLDRCKRKYFIFDVEFGALVSHIQRNRAIPFLPTTLFSSFFYQSQYLWDPPVFLMFYLFISNLKIYSLSLLSLINFYNYKKILFSPTFIVIAFLLLKHHLNH